MWGLSLAAVSLLFWLPFFFSSVLPTQKTEMVWFCCTESMNLIQFICKLHVAYNWSEFIYYIFICLSIHSFLNVLPNVYIRVQLAKIFFPEREQRLYVFVFCISMYLYICVYIYVNCVYMYSICILKYMYLYTSVYTHIYTNLMTASRGAK